MSLLDTLQAFLDQNQALEKLSPEGENGFAKEFLQIQTQSRSWVGDATHQTTNAQLQDNLWKNRFKDILPFDHNRVKLCPSPKEPCHDYINASHIKGIRGNYIASQGPMLSTVADFWRMILEYNILVVVMVCNIREAGKMKCERYWPYENEAKRFNDMVVTLDAEDRLSSDFTRRRLRVTCDNGRTQSLVQYHYTSWPDHGTPSNYTAILEMLAFIWDHDHSEKRRLLVHCSAGCGRTGTICAIDYAWNLLRERPKDISPSLVRDIVLNLRQQRVAMVQTKEQYEFTYRVVADLFSKHRDMTLLHDYVNVGHRGELKMEDDFVDLYESIYSLSVIPPAPNLQQVSVEPTYFNAIRQTLNRHLPDKKINLDSVEKFYASTKKRIQGQKPTPPERPSKKPEVSQNDKPEWASARLKRTSPVETVSCKAPQSPKMPPKLPPKLVVDIPPKVEDIYALPKKKRTASSSNQSENATHNVNQSGDVLQVDCGKSDRTDGHLLMDDTGTYAMCDFGAGDSSDSESDLENAYSYVSAGELRCGRSPEIEAALRRENIKRPRPAQLISLSMAKDSPLVKDQVQFSSVNDEDDRTSEQSSDGSAPASVFTRWKSKFQAQTRDIKKSLDSVNLRPSVNKPSALFHEGVPVNSWYKPSPVPCMAMDGVRTDFPHKYSRKPKGRRENPWP